MERINLISRSQGRRGQFGYRKRYTITQVENRVIVRWGRAELPTYRDQEQRFEFATEQLAKAFATEQMYKKMDKGYEKENANV